MSVVNLVLILIAAVLVSDIIKRRIEDVLPPLVFTLLLILYGVAILGKAHHSYAGTFILFALLWVFYIVKRKRPFPSPASLKELVLSTGFIIYLVVIVLMFIAFCNHFVIVWDDFH